MNFRQQKFVEQYFITGNATASAKYAGYSLKTAYSQGQRLLKNVEVAEALGRLRKYESERLSITKENVLSNLWKDANTAFNAADRISANMSVAKINGWVKENQSQTVAIFQDIDKELSKLNERMKERENAKPLTETIDTQPVTS